MSHLNFLWDHTKPEWVLVKNEKSGYSIFNKSTRELLLVEDVATHRMLCSQMHSHGVEILSKIPEGEFDLKNLHIQ